MRNFKNNLCTTFDKKEVLNQRNLAINMLSVTPDDRPMVGNLKQHPNVFVNGGHGQRSAGLAFVCAKAISEMVEGPVPEVEANELIESMHPKRFLV